MKIVTLRPCRWHCVGFFLCKWKMLPLFRSLLFLLLSGMLLAAVPLCAQEPLLPPPSRAKAGSESLPPLPRQNTDDTNAQLKAVGAAFSNSRVGNQQIGFSKTPAQTAGQNVLHLEKLPRSNSNPINHASFSQPTPSSMATHPMTLDEEVYDEAMSEESLDVDEYNEILDKPLSSKRRAKENEEIAEEEKPSGGWTNKLAKPELTPIFSVAGSLLIVIAAFFLLAILFRKVAPQGNRPLPKEAFECLGRHFLSQKQQLQVLRLGNRIVLVSVMAEGVTTLAEISDPDEVVAFLGHFRRLDSNSATEIFRRTVASISDDELSQSYGRPVVARRKAAPAARPDRASFDVYSDPDESLASILARGRR